MNRICKTSLRRSFGRYYSELYNNNIAWTRRFSHMSCIAMYCDVEYMFFFSLLSMSFSSPLCCIYPPPSFSSHLDLSSHCNLKLNLPMAKWPFLRPSCLNTMSTSIRIVIYESLKYRAKTIQTYWHSNSAQQLQIYLLLFLFVFYLHSSYYLFQLFLLGDNQHTKAIFRSNCLLLYQICKIASG